MRSRARTILLLGFAPGLLGCGLIDQCTYQERSVTGFNAVIENNQTTLRAELPFNEDKGSLNLKLFNTNITGTLKGHVTSIVLTSTADPSYQLSIPLDQPESPAIASGGLVQGPGDTSPDLSGVYDVIAGNHAVLVVTTDIAARPTLSLPLTVTHQQDWFRPQNCY